MSDKKEIEITQHGKRSVAIIAENGAKVVVNQPMSQTTADLSRPLEIQKSKIGESHIARKETELLLSWVRSTQTVRDSSQRVTILLGSAGSGKSVIMKDVLMALREENECEVIALKSDILFDDDDRRSLDEKANLGKPILQYIAESAQKQKTVLLIDQVDALSVVLSSHRKPLSEIMGLVHATSKIENVCIIISCRQYDFYYDQSFAELQRSNKIYVEKLSEQDVSRVLEENGISAEGLTPELKELLTNPLHLSLFYTIKPNIGERDIRTLTDLYSCLWYNVLTDYHGKPKDIVDYLWAFAYQLYTRQTLSIHPNLLPSELTHVGRFLLSRGFIVENHGVWQFMHQTLFDYVFARLFFEKQLTLKNVFEDNHQGLFVRNHLKQILDYQRTTDQAGYVGNLRSILFDKTSDRFKYLYRFHIRQLVLSMLAGYESLYPEERVFIEREVFKNRIYRHHFANSYISLEGFRVYKDWIDKHGGFDVAEKETQQDMVATIGKVIYGHQKEMLQYIRTLCTERLSEECRMKLIRIIDGLGEVELSKDLQSIIRYLDTEDNNILFGSLLHANMDKVEWIRERLTRCLRACFAAEAKEGLLFHSNVSHEVRLLYDDLKKRDEKIAYDLAYEMVRYVAELTADELKGDIKQSHAYWGYNRHNSMANQFHEELVDDMIEYMEAQAPKAEETWFVAELNRLTKTNWAILHVVACAAMTAGIVKYEQYAFAYLKRTIHLNYHSSPLTYYHIRLFKAWVEMNESKDALGELLEEVKTIHREWEKVYHEYENRQSPLTREGYTRAQYYACVPEEQLQQFPEAYQLYRESKMKYRYLSNEEPNRVEVFEGYKSMPAGVIDKIKSDKELLNLMRTHDKDNFYDFEKPTLSGISGEIASKVVSDPERYLRIYNQALPDKTIHIQYCMDGLKAMMAAEYPQEKIDDFYERLIAEALTRPEARQPATNITLCRYCDYYTKPQKHMPRAVFEFVKSVVLHPTEDVDEMEDIDYNIPINRERGRAIWVMMESMYDEEYVGELFPTLFAIADEASVTSKVGILFQMAYLLNIDRTKTLELFLRLTKDYNPNYFALPVHTGNALMYLIRTNFKDLIPYFEAAVRCDKGNDVTANLMFRAWMGGNEDAKPMLLEFADKSALARLQLVDIIAKNCNREMVEPMKEVLEHYLSKTDTELGRKYDYVFEHLKDWEKFFPTYDYLDKFLKSDAGVFCCHYIYSYLKYLANENPEYCLNFLSNLHKKKSKAYEIEFFELREITEILIAAYNNVRTYSNDNEALENAMDMLDELLEKEEVNSYLDRCLKTLND